MKPEEFSFQGSYNTVGLCRVERDDDEEPVMKINMTVLKNMVKAAERFDNTGSVWLWTAPFPESDAHTLIATPEKDSTVGIAAAGLVEREDG